MFSRTLAATALLVSSISANAGMIIVSADSNIGAGSNSTFFDNVFGGQDVYGRTGTQNTWATTNWAGVGTTTATSYNSSATLTAGDLQGVEWLISGSGSLYSASELAVLDDFVVGGGNVWVVGEAASLTAILDSANQVLGHLGSAMTLDAVVAESSSYTVAASGANPLLAGAPLWGGNYAGRVLGGEALYTNVGGDALLAMGSTGVPLPAGAWLFGSALVGLVGLRRKR